MENKIVVFLPTYNERDNLPHLVEQLFSLRLDLSIVIVDDQSPDGTGEIAEQLAVAHTGRIRVIHRDGTRGRGKAGIVGLREASQMPCELVVEMDADLSHDPTQLPVLLEAAQSADLVIGSRYMPGGVVEEFGWLRMLNSKIARGLSAMILGLHYTDPTSGYRVYRSEILARIPWDRLISPGPSIVEETLYHLQRMGARIVEVPITYKKRLAGNTKITLGIIMQWIITLLNIRRAAKAL